MQPFTKKFSEITMKDVPVVGGKNASLGEMYNNLSSKGIAVPGGFATTSGAFRYFLEKNAIGDKLEQLLEQLDRKEYSNLTAIGKQARALLLQATLPDDLQQSILQLYRELCGEKPFEVAVRSSATAEDLPQASFAGQHESYLNIKGDKQLLEAVHQCFASLYTDRAIKYREDNGFAHEKVALSAGIQKMVRSDLSCAGVCFTLEPESGFNDIVYITGVWGLGENIVQGAVTPDEFFVFKPTLQQGKKAIIRKKLGEKSLTMVYAQPGNQLSSTINLETPVEQREHFVLSDEEVETIARWAVIIEQHYNLPMDIEWAKDGLTGSLYIVQARPETVHSQKDGQHFIEYRLLQKGEVLAQGEAVGNKATTGIARVLQSPQEAGKLKKGEIVVTGITSPDWDPVLKRAAAIVTDKGGRTSHASIVARELGVPAIVGCNTATQTIQDGQPVTVSCCEGKTGFVYKGILPVSETAYDFSKSIKPEKTKAMLIAADPDQAFKLSMYPNDGIGLLRIEFIITHLIQVHPMALVKFDELNDPAVKQQIEELTHHYPDKEKYFVDRLAQGIATFAAAFYPKDVIVRMSDFKTNEYANLAGGKQFEPHEENPMLGFRGASRYYNDLYKDGFRLECEALYKVRNEMGLTNVKAMIPFCRTVEEGKKVIRIMEANGLNRQTDPSLEIYVMAEIPSNVIEAEAFAQVFDGFSIGSNDLTQLTLGIDRDSALVSQLFNEQDSAVKYMIAAIIQKARDAGVKIGLCGQAPSDFPEFARFLVQKGINSISFNADAIIKGMDNMIKAETAQMQDLLA